MVGTRHTLMTYAMYCFYCCHARQGAGWLPHAPSRIPALSREIIWLLRARTSTAEWICDILRGTGEVLQRTHCSGCLAHERLALGMARCRSLRTEDRGRDGRGMEKQLTDH
jgi:hypothetical protein